MRTSRNAASARGGFTLVEMLVAMTLVVMMMLMFAQIFGVAVGTMRNQRSLANNDQKARALTALLRGDLNAATFKSQLYSDSQGLVPLFAGDIVDPNQKGYFYIAENDPGSETDDNLQFTIWVQDPIAGRAQPIGRPDGSGGSLVDLNQPDGDDGIIGNGVTWSRAAEVSYFLRGGTLFRRVLLLRDPLAHNPAYSGQPTLGPNGLGADLGGYVDRIMPIDYDGSADLDPATDTSGSGTSDFWNDLDSSASRVWYVDDNTNSAIDAEPTDLWKMHFHSIDSLDNNRGTENSPLALPGMRFGHDPLNGQPLEFLTTGYMGRFTHEETSHPDFGYPGVSNANYDTPYVRVGGGGGLTLFGDTIVEYANGPRAGEDIVMTGVEAFNIEVLDEGWTLETTDRNEGGFPKFVDMGQDLYPTGNGGDPNDEFAGDFAIDRNLNRLDSTTTTGYGLHTMFHSNTLGEDILAGNKFDTWHPGATVGSGIPPYRSLSTFNTSDYDDVFTVWGAGAAIDDSSTSASGFPDVVVLNNQSIAYVCLVAGTTGAIEPEWPLVPGAEVSDGSVIWRAIDNRIGLKMMRITIRYIDAQTQGLRQLSIYHSFVESR